MIILGAIVVVVAGFTNQIGKIIAKTTQPTNKPTKIPRINIGIDDHHCNSLHEHFDL
jgi:hypothetical protein